MRKFILLLLAAGIFSSMAAEDRAQKVLQDAAKVNQDGYWIYNDLPAGINTARITGKPLLVVLRCVP